MFSNGIARILSALLVVMLFWNLTGCATFKANATIEFKAQVEVEGTAATGPIFPAPATTTDG